MPVLPPLFLPRYQDHELSRRSIERLRSAARVYGVDTTGFVDKREYVHAIVEACLRKGYGTVDEENVYTSTRHLFTSLPAELRNKIYERVLVAENEAITLTFTADGQKIHRPTLSPACEKYRYNDLEHDDDWEEWEPSVNYKSRDSVKGFIAFSQMNQTLRKESTSFFFANNTFEVRPLNIAQWPQIHEDLSDNSIHPTAAWEEALPKQSHFPAYAPFLKFLQEKAGDNIRAMELRDDRNLRSIADSAPEEWKENLANPTSAFFNHLAGFPKLEILAIAISPYQVAMADMPAFRKFFEDTEGSEPLPRQFVAEFAASLAVLPNLEQMDIEYETDYHYSARAAKYDELMDSLKEELQASYIRLHKKTISIDVMEKSYPTYRISSVNGTSFHPREEHYYLERSRTGPGGGNFLLI